MATNTTKLRSLHVENFRGLNDIEINFGERITIICGKNGTSKSTILGLVAQIFSFNKDLSTVPATQLNEYKTLADTPFKSAFSEHFRISELHDTPGSMSVNYKVYDGTVDKNLDNITLGLYYSRDRRKARAVVRGNDGIPDINTSRNLTHPVIFLSLKRLLPITLRTTYSERSVEYIVKNSNKIMAMNNRLLIKNTSKNITATTGTIESLVVHGDNYDHESVSVGEDNVGQIIQAIFSFKRLKEVYTDYHGGILLIDEADAGLFPAAQVKLIEVLKKAAKDYNLQIIMTSHSPLIIEDIYHLNKKAEKDYRTIYLTDSFGEIQVKNNYSWPEINADLLVKTIKVKDSLLFPKINVYFEDREAFDLFRQIITENKVKKILNPLKDINISCTTVFDLMARKIPEFINKSLIVLDGDVQKDNSQNAKKAKKEKNLCLLPTVLPPDQLIFEFLYNLEPEDPYWDNNDAHFTKTTFLGIASDIIEKLDLGDAPIQISESVSLFRKKIGDQKKNGVTRDLFKNFVHHEDFIEIVNGSVKYNPYRYWASKNPDKIKSLRENVKNSLIYILTSGHGASLASVLGYLGDDS
ncbi:AAA family ATPase [Yersinia frederiksenii]|uniref:AAA family ATPase n=1 Tax=Yersinia frederiksenii TaxID=29484 RepID=UPI0005DB8482|nr:AAA family ATPase [Yersinia frederiksenii]CQJ05291.1 Predicted ATP-binding protein involved in virulence [Yersinia frederiksenii]